MSFSQRAPKLTPQKHLPNSTKEDSALVATTHSQHQTQEPPKRQYLLFSNPPPPVSTIILHTTFHPSLVLDNHDYTNLIVRCCTVPAPFDSTLSQISERKYVRASLILCCTISQSVWDAWQRKRFHHRIAQVLPTIRCGAVFRHDSGTMPNSPSSIYIIQWATPQQKFTANSLDVKRLPCMIIPPALKAQSKRTTV